jgi:heparan-alpha-glucosaminide N-acetyltransferase
MNHVSRRVASIDAFRAITMFFMIFVNDLVLDFGVPDWLEHAREGEDRLGFADTIFPAFLFIVGCSIPLAVGERRGRVVHILRRSLALLVMGFFLVNYEEYTTGPAGVSKFAWLLIVTLAFFFIWLVYPQEWPRWRKWVFRGFGIAVLAVMACIYQGGSPEHPSWMQTHWWGILGLIGWAYLTCALLYLVIGDRLPLLGMVFLYFLGFSIVDCSGWRAIRHVLPYLSLGGSGGLSAFTMAGVITTVFYRRMSENGRAMKSLYVLLAWVPVLVAAGFLLRPLKGISKLEDSPSWILICTGIPVACVAMLAYIVDIRGRQGWYRWIKPAGTITLTCYLLPDIHFAIIKLLGPSWQLPEVLRTGVVGVGKSLVFALLIVLLTGVLEKKKIRLSV